MTDYEYYRDKFNAHIECLSKFPVWTYDQIRGYTHLHYDTIQKLVNLRILYKFNIGRLTFYSLHNRQYTNQSIVKSILRIDTYFRTHYRDLDGFIFDNRLDNKSLFSKNVEKIGYISGGSFLVNYYNIYSIHPTSSVKDYKRIEKLLIDVYTASGSDYVQIGIVCYDSDINALEEYLEASGTLIPYTMTNAITYYFVNVNYPHLSQLSYNL